MITEDQTGTTVTIINNDEDRETYFENLSEDAVISIDLPFNVTLSEGTQQTITSYDEFYDLIFNCYIEDGDFEVDCFDLNFPVTALDYEGNEITVNSEQELYTFDFVGFVYPISVTLEDGVQVTINSSQEFDALYNDCFDIEDCDDCEIQCFDIVFPLSMISDSGVVEVINGYEELFDFLNGLNEDDVFMISYPLTVEFEDGTQQTVNSDDEFEALYDSCD
jgi:hypothetical protein